MFARVRKTNHQVKRGNDNHEEAESNAPRPAFMDERDRTIEIAKNHIHEIQNRDASGCSDDADLESLGGADDSGLISEQQNKEGTESQSHGLNRNAGVSELKHGRDAAQRQAFEEGVNGGGDWGPFFLENGNQCDEESTEQTANHP